MNTYARYRILYWLKYTVGLGRYTLFLGIVGRDFHGVRLTPRLAWDVARTVSE